MAPGDLVRFAPIVGGKHDGYIYRVIAVRDDEVLIERNPGFCPIQFRFWARRAAVWPKAVLGQASD